MKKSTVSKKHSKLIKVMVDKYYNLDCKYRLYKKFTDKEYCEYLTIIRTNLKVIGECADTLQEEGYDLNRLPEFLVEVLVKSEHIAINILFDIRKNK